MLVLEQVGALLLVGLDQCDQSWTPVDRNLQKIGPPPRGWERHGSARKSVQLLALHFFDMRAIQKNFEVSRVIAALDSLLHNALDVI